LANGALPGAGWLRDGLAAQPGIRRRAMTDMLGQC
jgi:hypothetical protein